ncbi:MAG: branched-chain amino acid ABC transporter permease [Gammaproteobacteria bacterium]|jgi:branched-chain amino acid transport system permease protein|uniref:Amino acid/amide ABC transporter membrane protein 1, HAAT family n=1 Tax=Marinomonas polaris DSM 16579 TaxID=1122206 RepID=A0A1M4V836_9GAMM|nr:MULTISPECIES: branched-chain amino acid ABC transporter permease [Marinomonas]MBU1293787.1 branched-chain amino acid ABC transporter permease [Gammaproteobacteria bacterium]MBU1465278.1 branched-chain amino acid ABC transporter permease [Gammaproteobacteria bacterium]MBU2024014.1 branched-chain amino acid ABC transporter permease [Gammaproteobacteria bacterium]MBU2240356.1 branched-chain amino acid ABC transporter permease [Gammaproteobacteria bacterium]MBU2317738.1 branched-chain amino aci|tara:strand:- start:8649 stop:9512 length:864 start_codon:yes stop_codon:yes gene_type:complete
MDSTLFIVQLINGLQYGLLLFLIASGLTLVFGVMGILNLAHGSMFMVGAYLAWYFVQQTGSFAFSAVISAVIALLIGFLVERTLIRQLYRRNHLDQVLLTIGMIFVFNALQGLLWGNDPLGVDVPQALSASIPLAGIIEYPVYRIFVAVFCVVVAGVMYYVISKTRLGMLIRAGESNREMVECLGIDISRLYTIVFAIGVMLSAVAGVVAAPISSIVPGMGEHILITCFVVVVIGGMGSIKGAFIGALMVGLVDTFASVLVPELSSMMIYIFMAFILLLKPQGLFSS